MGYGEAMWQPKLYGDALVCAACDQGLGFRVRGSGSSVYIGFSVYSARFKVSLSSWFRV